MELLGGIILFLGLWFGLLWVSQWIADKLGLGEAINFGMINIIVAFILAILLSGVLLS